MTWRAAAHRDVWAGVILLLLGIVVTTSAFEHSFGSLRRLGAGAFPFAYGLALIGFGVAILLQGLRHARPGPEIPWGRLWAIPVGMLAWAYLAPRTGLVPATLVLIAVSAFAQRPVRPVSVLVIAAVLSLAGTLMFVQGLKVPLSAFGR